MKEVVIVGLVLILGGCVDLHTSRCTPQKDGYADCRHYVEYHTEPACIGSCAKK